MQATGPAAGDPRLAGEIKGTLNNCAGGITPWGTVLSGEENFNQYFDVSVAIDPASPDFASYTRLVIPTSVTKTSRAWSDADPRFDLGTNPNEAYKFGWIIEVDPYDMDSTPKKRTMLGRFKHEGGTISIARDGRVVVYMGDDERGDYLYKFVSRDTFHQGSSRRAREHNMTLLDFGTLYVAAFDGDSQPDPYDGGGTWIPLTSDLQSYVPGFDVSEVLINTRLAADTMGATKMDRPEDVERNPVNGKVYLALTNNSNRGSAAMPANPANTIVTSFVRASLDAPLTSASGNRNGYVLELDERRNDAAAVEFSWQLFLVCGDPEAPETYFGGYPKEEVSPISCPDNLAFDPRGNLWIATDGNVLGSNDGLFAVPVRGSQRGKVQQFLTMPYGAETCGPLVSEDGRSVFVSVQHPGETEGSTFTTPSSTWPNTNAWPRPGVACVWHSRGRRVGA